MRTELTVEDCITEMEAVLKSRLGQTHGGGMPLLVRMQEPPDYS